MSQFAQFLIVRSDDLVILGVQWSGFRSVPAAQPVLEAQSNDARVVLTFPPQAITEEKFSISGDVARRGARLAGSSRVTFEVQAGTKILLNAEGVLEALARFGQKVVSSGTGVPTAIELPWHLIISAQALSGGEVVSDHAPLPVASASGVVGLWHSRLRARDGSANDAGLALLPLDLDRDDEGLDVEPLSGGQRQSIFDALPTLAHARRVELSALGGSLSARLTTQDFEWDHDTALGRDQRVRVLARGVLYPFGHRAEYSVLTERLFDPSGSPTVAGMHRQQMLVITEPVRATTDGGAQLVRQFPFSEVEIRTRSFTDLAPDNFETVKRDPFPSDDLQDDITRAQEELQPLLSAFADAFAAQPQTLNDYINQGFGSSPQLQNAQLMADRDPDAMKRRQQEIDAEISFLLHSIPTDPPPPPPEFIDEFLPPPPPPPPRDTDQIDAILEKVDQLRAERAEVSDAIIAQVRAEAPFWAAEVVRLQAAVKAEFEATDTLDKFIAQSAAFGDQGAQRVQELRDLIASRQAEIEAIRVEAQTKHDVFWSPRTSDQKLLQFPLRCASGNGDVYFSVPLIFVKDFELPGSEHFPFFASLTDTGVAQSLAEEWGANSNIPLPGVPIDLVRGTNPHPRPGDIHEVHQLSIAGVPHDGGFRPTLTQIKVNLPALRALLPDHPNPDGSVALEFTPELLNPNELVALKFTPEFLNAGEQVDVPLKLVQKNLKVDFTERADRSGGLVSPKFVVDAISRTLGPVPKGALPGQGLPDLSSIYAGATLLGFPLGSVINIEGPGGPPLPLMIVPVLVPGQPPGVRMQWNDLRLKDHGPLQTTSSTKLNLTVERSPLKTETTCTVENFSLALPPGGEELLRLTFGSLVFIQQAGHAPDLQVNGLDVKFAGGLELLRGLQEKLMGLLGLGDNKPTVHATPAGIIAAYTLSLPSVSAGAFLLRNIALYIGIDVPFDSHPVTVSLAFARRDNPFNLSVLMFGGGGYIDLQIGPTGLTRLEASMDFGASVAVDFIVASGEVHALGGLRYVQVGASVELDGFIRIGGSVEVLGLVSVSIELLITLNYESVGNRMVGRATLVIDVDLTLFSESVEIDSGEWVLIGGDSAQPTAEPSQIRDALFPMPDEADLFARTIREVTDEEDPGLKAWRTYREAFHEGGVA